MVGPARAGRRDDGSRGAVIVEKVSIGFSPTLRGENAEERLTLLCEQCRFLEQSNCKGMCLHICKSPAQEFFSSTLGVPLKVSPNFATHECHWVWGVEAEEVGEDEEWPRGCLEGCESRKQVAAMGR